MTEYTEILNHTSAFGLTSLSNGSSTRVYNRPFSEADIIVAAIFLLPLMVLGIFGNVLTIVTITVSPKLNDRSGKSVFNILILSLCVSDLTSALISPLFLYRRTWGFDNWNLAPFFCKLYWSVDLWTSFVTALHIVMFAVVRLISIEWPVFYGKLNRRYIRIIICIVWLTTFLCGFLPMCIWFNSGQRNRNSGEIDANWPACTLDVNWMYHYGTYSLVVFPIFFYLPVILVLILTVSITVLLRTRVTSRKMMLSKTSPARNGLGKRNVSHISSEKEMQAMLQLALIAGSFMFGYIPISVYEIASTNTPSVTPEDSIYWWRFGMWSYTCLRISETLNPVFYNLASRKMRTETKRVCKSILRSLACKKCSIKSNSGSTTARSSVTTISNTLDL